MISFDDYLETFIKFGPYQVKMFFIVSLIDFMDGMETAFLGIFLSILASEWSLTINEIIGLGTAFYFGKLSGNIFCALFADKIGRKNSFIIGIFVTFLTFILNSQVQAYWQLCVMRLTYGAVFDAVTPLSSILMGEMVTKDFRGRTQSCLQIVYIFGKMYLLLTCYIFLDDLKGGNWRGLLLFNSVPALICFFFSFMYLRESARFYLSKGRYVEGVREIRLMGKTNQGSTFCITQAQIDNLISWQLKRYYDSNETVGILELFNHENRSLTLRLCSIQIMIQISFATFQLLIPFWLQSKNSDGFLSIFYTYLAKLAAGLILIFIIDKRELGGRLRIITVSFVFMIFSVVIIYLNPERYLVVGISIFKFFITLLLPTIMVFIIEGYSTLHRSMGMGLVKATGRVASAFTPLVGFTLYAIDPYSPLVVIFFCLIIALIITVTFDSDKTQQNLDQSKRQSTLPNEIK